MATGKITKRSVDSLEAQGRDELLWDVDLRGFGVKATPAGSKRYLVQYRMAGRASTTKRWTIGRHGTWDPATARERAGEILRLVSSGIDPHVQARERESSEQARAAEEQRLEFSVYAERFLIDYGKREWRARTLKSAESNMRR